MKIRAAILSCFLLFALPLFARESTDVLVMRNGDRLTGTIKALYGGVLYFSLPYVIDTLSVDWTKVARLESKQLFIVKTEDGSVYNGTLSSSESCRRPPHRNSRNRTHRDNHRDKKPETPHRERPLRHLTAEKTVSLNSERITGVTQTSEKFFQRFTGGLAVDPSTQRATNHSSTASAD